MKRIVYYEHPLYFMYWLNLVKKIDAKEWADKMKEYDSQYDDEHPIKKAIAFIDKYYN